MMLGITGTKSFTKQLHMNPRVKYLIKGVIIATLNEMKNVQGIRKNYFYRKFL